MPVYLLGAIDIEDAEVYDEYQRKAALALKDFEVEFLSSDDRPKLFEGKQPAGHLFVIKFASQAELDRFYESPGYQEAIPLREASSRTHYLMAMKAA